ncbi:MAG: hypothetical protein R3F61_30375 [Myxococcota bacterium]
MGWSLGGRVAGGLAGGPGVLDAVVVDATPDDPRLPEGLDLAWLFAGSIALRASSGGLSRDRVHALGLRRALRHVLEHAIDAGFLPADTPEDAIHARYDAFRHGLAHAVRQHAVDRG